MAGTTGTMGKAAGLIGVYALGFGIPFLLVGVFTKSLLDFLKRKRGILRYTVKIAAALMIFMGVMTFTGLMNGVTGYLSAPAGQSVGTAGGSDGAAEPGSTVGGSDSAVNQSSPAAGDGGAADQSGPAAETGRPETSQETARETGTEESRTEVSETSEPAEATEDAQGRELLPAPEFTLMDQYGVEHSLSDYKGKVIFLNFWATWCPPCRAEMPDIQALYEDHGSNGDDLVVLGIAGPGMGQEGNTEHVKSFLSKNGYSYPVLMDEGGGLFETFGIYSFPTTFMIDKEGNVFGYVIGGISGATMEDIVRQTMGES